MSVDSPKKLERNKRPACGCEETTAPNEYTIRGYDLDYRIEKCANLTKHR